MLPTAYPRSVSLAAVLSSCFAALDGGSPALPLPAVDSAVVVLADGLGAGDPVHPASSASAVINARSGEIHERLVLRRGVRTDRA